MKLACVFLNTNKPNLDLMVVACCIASRYMKVISGSENNFPAMLATNGILGIYCLLTVRIIQWTI